MRENTFLVLAPTEGSDWIRNALSAGVCRVRLGKYYYTVTPERTDAKTAMIALDAFLKSFQKQLVSKYYGRNPICLSLRPQGPPILRGYASGEQDSRLSYDKWIRENSDYMESVSGAFDSAAEEYDFTISNNYINSWIRKASIAEIVMRSRPSDNLLEIGCGTGEEAIKISKYVNRVVATDVSEQMLKLLELKLRAKRLGSKVVPVLLRASDVGMMSDFTGGRGFDIVYSLNGALNCEPAIGRFVYGLDDVLKEGGYFICSVRNTLCASEFVTHLAAMQLRKTSPRKHQPQMVSVGGRDIPAYYYPPSIFEHFFEGRLKLVRRLALPAVMPPAYLSDYYLGLGRLRAVLERLEAMVAHRFPMNLLGDQTLFVFRKV
jgi:ubiquinone/menaquinone biosynthesis C-methylase UbiE